MQQLNELKPYGYGMLVFSPDKFRDFLKVEKCRAKKLLTYFDKNKNVFFKAIETGVALPFYKLSVCSYPVFVFVNEAATTPDGWQQVYRYDDFFIQVGDSNKLCFAAFEYLEIHKNLFDQGQTTYSENIPNGPDEVMITTHTAVGADIAQGNYRFSLIAYKRKEPLDESIITNYGRNYAFGFVFKSTASTANDNLTKCDNEKTVFDIQEHDKF